MLPSFQRLFFSKGTSVREILLVLGSPDYFVVSKPDRICLYYYVDEAPGHFNGNGAIAICYRDFGRRPNGLGYYRTNRRPVIGEVGQLFVEDLESWLDNEGWP